VDAKRARAARKDKIRIKAGDTVFVRSGRDRQSRLTPEEIDRLDADAQRRTADRRPGRRGRVIRVLRDRRHVIVEGVNMLVKHARPRGRATRSTQMQSGRTEQPGPIAISNVMLVCPSCDRPTRVRRGEVEGKTVRVCVRCGEPVDAIR
jgi:large subunit ribosomal protein L24